MSLPNLLTLVRMGLVPVFMYFMLADIPAGSVLALIVFIAAAVTDQLDGYIARKYNLITSFGKIMDPLADKLLVMAAFLIFASQGRMSPVALMIIITRELAVSSLRVVAIENGHLMAAGFTGKIKTVVQILACIVLLVNLPALGVPYADRIDSAVVWISAAVTLWSGIEYFYSNKALIAQVIKPK